MTRILVTGGAGWVGGPLTARLVAAGHEVHVASRRGCAPPGAVAHAVDLLRETDTAELLGTLRPSHLVHLAWFLVPGRFWQAEEENAAWQVATERMLDLFVGTGGTHIVATGTVAELEARPSPYGAAKSAVRARLSEIAASTSVRTAWVRICQPYGPGEHEDRLIPSLVRRLSAGEIVETTAGNQERDFIHIQDVVAAVDLVVTSAASGTFDAGTGIPTPVRDVIVGVAERLGAEERLRLGAVPVPAHESPRLIGDPTRLRDAGWEPTWSLDAGLDEAVRWWQGR